MAGTDIPDSLSGSLSQEGRVVIPVEVRRLLGLRAGDRVHFLLTESGVQLTTAEQLARRVWANNHGGDGGDATELVREMRTADQEVGATSETEQEELPPLEEDDLLRLLGRTR